MGGDGGPAPGCTSQFKLSQPSEMTSDQFPHNPPGGYQVGQFGLVEDVDDRLGWAARAAPLLLPPQLSLAQVQRGGAVLPREAGQLGWGRGGGGGRSAGAELQQAVGVGGQVRPGRHQARAGERGSCRVGAVTRVLGTPLLAPTAPQKCQGQSRGRQPAAHFRHCILEGFEILAERSY